jgi:hypothetical protein
MSIARDQPYPGGIAPHHHPEAVKLDLVDPVGAGRQAIGGRGKAGLDKRRDTHSQRFFRAPAAAVKPQRQRLANGTAGIAESGIEQTVV